MNAKLETGKFIGVLRASRTLQGLTLAETSYTPGLSVPAHVHDSATLALVLDGAMTEQRGRAGKLLEEGGLLFHPAHEPHGHQFHSAGARCFVVQFGGSWTERMRALGEDEPRVPFGLERSRANWMARALHREFLENDAASALAVEGFALAILSELARARASRVGGRQPSWLRNAEELLRTSATGEAISMAHIATVVGVHPTHLSRSFRRHYGMSMGEYLRRVRVEHAQRELACGTKPIATIAAEAGFADQAHFSRVFRQITGHTPRDFRLSHPPGSRLPD